MVSRGEGRGKEIESWKFRQLNKNKYYLYLVPIGKGLSVLKNEIQIIQDPYKHILHDKKNWIRNIELMSFRKDLIS